MSKWTVEAERMLPYIQKGAQMLGDTDALEIKTIYPEWDATATYEVDNKVLYNNSLYRCLSAHTAQETWTPTDAPSLWTKVLIPEPGVIPEWEQPESTNPYMAGDKVTHNGKTWVSTVDNNVWEPGVYGWDEVTEHAVP